MEWQVLESPEPAAQGTFAYLRNHANRWHHEVRPPVPRSLPPRHGVHTMSTQSLTLTLTNDDMRFEAVVGSGHTVVMDNGAGDTGARPSELLGVALAGCTAMDVISILRKKRQAVARYEVRVAGTQVEAHPHNFTRFDVVHVVEGDPIDPAAVARAIELSATKYCAVGSTLTSGDLEIHHAYLIRTPGGEELSAEVLVTGPHASAAALAAGA